ncbi:MAG: hypothetical protein ACFNL1_07515, partial [Prevotella histicola]
VILRLAEERRIERHLILHAAVARLREFQSDKCRYIACSDTVERLFFVRVDSENSVYSPV